MLPGTIIMLLFIIVVILGGTCVLVKMNLSKEKDHIESEAPVGEKPAEKP